MNGTVARLTSLMIREISLPQSELRRQEEEAKKLRLQGQNPDAGKDDGDLMSVAKDWAGELISGQTGTGRILVRKETLFPYILTIFN